MSWMNSIRKANTDRMCSVFFQLNLIELLHLDEKRNVGGLVMNKRWGAGILAAAMIFMATPPAEATEVISENVYQWVQSTARQNYYFNKQQFYFAQDKDGYMTPDSLLVPVLKTYDQVQIRDVVSKRRWKGLSTSGYDDLVGCAEYLKFNLKEQTAQVMKHDDLDSDWGVIGTVMSDKVVKITELSDKDVDAKFYRAILKYASNHYQEIYDRTQTVKGAKDPKPEVKRTAKERVKDSKNKKKGRVTKSSKRGVRE